MKNLFFLALLPLMTVSLYAQKNFAPLGAEWKYEGWHINCEGNHIKYTVTREEMINDRDCSWITAYQWSDDVVAWLTQDSLLVWEDDNRVFFYEDTDFYLLYDFNALPGDTVMAYDPIGRDFFTNSYYQDSEEVPHLYPYYVGAVGELEIEGLTYKTFTTEAFYFMDRVRVSQTIVENIGSDASSLTGSGGYVVAMGCHGGFVCYRNDDIYYESGFLSCENLTPVEDIALSQTITIFPNPTRDFVEISYPGPHAIARYQLYDLSGKLLQVGSLANKIDLTALPSGVYYFKLRLNNGESICKKLVKD